MNTILRKTTGQTLMAVALGFAMLAGCTKDKKDVDYASKFAGTWNGTATCNGGSGGTGQAVFTKVDNKTITTNYSVGTGSCALGKTLTGTADETTINFPTTTVSDGCGGSYSVSAHGSISGNTLTYTVSVNGAANGSCTFTGSK
ncbi:MAG: hypothetical protein KF744_12255 [Taibaiella sp.]|nr:hypothetical protein [Taibaiella sp.]